MIKSISIQNLGLIQNTSLQFSSGFSVITGETGAGKSFFFRAIELSLGSRAKETPGKLRTVIETEFGDHIFRRVLENKKSRFFIDDYPEKLEMGKAFALEHLNMHSQHDNIFLKQKMLPLSCSIHHFPLKSWKIFILHIQHINLH